MASGSSGGIFSTMAGVGTMGGQNQNPYQGPGAPSQDREALPTLDTSFVNTDEQLPLLGGGTDTANSEEAGMNPLLKMILGFSGLGGLPSKEDFEALSVKMEELRRAPPRQSLDTLATQVGRDFHANNPITASAADRQAWMDGNIAAFSQNPWSTGEIGQGYGDASSRVFRKAPGAMLF